MQNRTLNMFNSPGPAYEVQARRQGDPNFIFVNAVPNVSSGRDHGVPGASPYYEVSAANPFHEPPKSDRGISTTFQTYTPNSTEARRLASNSGDNDPNDSRHLTTFNSKSIQNKYGLGVRILEKTPRNSNSDPDRRPPLRGQLGSDELGRTEIRVLQPPHMHPQRLHTPIKGQHLVVESDRVVKQPTVQTANISSPVPNALFSRDPRLDQGHLNAQRFDAYHLQPAHPVQPARIQAITKTPQNVPVQSRPNVPTLSLGSTDFGRTVTPNGSLPRPDQRREGGPALSQHQQSVSNSSNTSPGYFSDVAFAQFGQNYPTLGPRKVSQPLEEAAQMASSKSVMGSLSVVVNKPAGGGPSVGAPATPAFPVPPHLSQVNSEGVLEIIRMNESKQAEEIITHHLPFAKDGSSQNQQTYPATQNTQPTTQSQHTIKTVLTQTAHDAGMTGLLSPKSSHHQITSSETLKPAAGFLAQSVQPRLTEVSQLAGELVRLNLEGIGSYEGTVRNNALNGYGKLSDSRGRLVYEGEFSENQFMGLGVLYNHDSAGDRVEARGGPSVPENWVRYEGLFYNNQKNGKGDLFYGDGGLFSGDFEGDLANGSGVLRLASGESLRGHWKNGVLVSRN